MKIILLVLIFLNIIFAQTTSDEKIVKINGSKFKKLDIDKDFKSMQKGCYSGVTIPKYHFHNLDPFILLFNTLI